MTEILMQVIERAKTYQVFKWHYHNPNIFNPYKLASQGYECTNLNVLQCHVCHNSVPFTTSEGQQRQEVKILGELLNHHPSCSYFEEQGESFTRPQLYLRMDQLIQSVKQSYKNNDNEKLFPVPNLKKFKQQLANNSQTQMLNAVLNKSKMSTAQVKISFILTIMGWAKKSMEIVECSFCGRSVNIKDFKLKMEDKVNYDETDNINEEELLDLFNEHRYFCFWVYDQKGWEIYIQHLFDKLGEAEELFRNLDPEDVKKIRTLIDGYLQKFKNIINENFEKTTKVLTECSEMVKQIQENEEDAGKIEKQVQARKRQMRQFLQQIENQVRAPLKRVKID